MAFKYANYLSRDVPAASESSFTIHVSAPTDIWRKPPANDVFDAPILYKLIPISSFKSSRVTVTAYWKTMYDQGGLIFVLPPTDGGKSRWIKAGVEFYHGKSFMSVVVADQWADWSLSPIPSGTVTLEMERGLNADVGSTPVLYVYVVGDDGVRVPVREVTSVFHDVDEDGDCWVGTYAAKPTLEQGNVPGDLEVKFSGFKISQK